MISRKIFIALIIPVLLTACKTKSDGSSEPHFERVDDLRELTAQEYTVNNITAVDEYGRVTTTGRKSVFSIMFGMVHITLVSLILRNYWKMIRNLCGIQKAMNILLLRPSITGDNLSMVIIIPLIHGLFLVMWNSLLWREWIT